MIGCSCYECKKEVPRELEKHFIAKDGRILCDECSKGVEPCSKEIFEELKKLEQENK